MGQNIIAEMVVGFSETNEKKCKFIQFVAIFWFLKLGRPLTNFESMKKLFDILKVKNIPCKHWFDSTGWHMAKNMHWIIIESTKRPGTLLLAIMKLPQSITSLFT
jgi:hypothetical protein